MLSLSTNSLRKLVILVIVCHLDIIRKCEGCREFQVVGEVEPNDGLIKRCYNFKPFIIGKLY
jgi:hypothetical protein